MTDKDRIDELESGSHFHGFWSHTQQKWTITIHHEVSEGKTLREAIDAQMQPIPDDLKRSIGIAAAPQK